MQPPRDVPAYLPALAHPVLPWARGHVARVARRYHTSADDLWDETVTALLRAAHYFQPQDPSTYSSPDYPAPLAPDRSFIYYAKIAIHRACWRYVCRRAVARPVTVVLDIEWHELAQPSAETEALAREAITQRLAAPDPTMILVHSQERPERRKGHARH